MCSIKFKYIFPATAEPSKNAGYISAPSTQFSRSRR